MLLSWLLPLVFLFLELHSSMSREEPVLPQIPGTGAIPGMPQHVHKHVRYSLLSQSATKPVFTRKILSVVQTETHGNTQNLLGRRASP